MARDVRCHGGELGGDVRIRPDADVQRVNVGGCCDNRQRGRRHGMRMQDQAAKRATASDVGHTLDSLTNEGCQKVSPASEDGAPSIADSHGIPQQSRLIPSSPTS
nr:hypothetical protein CFP56_04409 [Quercus suber]